MQGILGGTFDPPHKAHIAMARQACAQLGLSVVRLMPAGDPWQKRDIGVSDAYQRWAMTEHLASTSDCVVADDTEIRRDGASYTIDTVEELGERCVLILGADAALGIPTWHRGQELLDLVDLAVAPRPGVSIGQVEAALGREVTELAMDPVELSSTEIRGRVASGVEYRDLVTGAVYDYIEEHQLYRLVGTRSPASLSSTPMTKRHKGAAPDAVEAARAAAAAMDDKAGEDISLLDLSDLLVVTDVFVLATGTSKRHTMTLVDEVVEALKQLDRRPIRKEGTDHGQWVLLDYGDVVIHVFERMTREYYDLERLWADAPRIEFEPRSSTTAD